MSFHLGVSAQVVHNNHTESIFAMGDMEHGQLGDGAPTSDPETKFPTRSIPIAVPASGPMKGKKILKIDANGATTYFLDEDGVVYSSGYGNQGQLGIGHTNDITVPEQIPPYGDMVGKQITSLCAGNRHGLFLDDTGEVYGTGFNLEGALALGDSKNRYVPTRISRRTVNSSSLGDTHAPSNDVLPEGVALKSVACGYFHSFFVTKDTGTVYASGFNKLSQTGNGDDDNLLWATRIPPPESVMYGKNIVHISAGYYHSLFLSDDGEAFAVGFGGFGQLGTLSTESVSIPVSLSMIPSSPFNRSRIVSVSAGGYFSIFLTEDGVAWTVGQNQRGQLGTGHRSLFESIPFNVSSMGDLRGSFLIKVSTGHEYSLFLDVNGNLFHVGDDSFAQSGRNSSQEQFSTPSLCWVEVEEFGNGMSSTFIMEKLPCEAGTSWDFKNRGCATCPAGHYCKAETVYYSPRNCPDYMWSKSGAASVEDCSKEECGEGYLCLNGEKTACPKDTWSTLGDSQCSDCPANYICLGNGHKEWDTSFSSFMKRPLGMLCAFAVILFVSVIVMICCMICIVFYCIWRSQKVVRKKTDTMSRLLAGYEKDMQLDEFDENVDKVRIMVKESLLEIDFDEIELLEKIGSGGGEALVFRGYWNKIEVACKMFKSSRLTGEKLHSEFQKELAIMAALRHPRLVLFYGCTVRYPRIGLVMEFCSGGSIADNIKNRRITTMSINEVYRILLQICEGLNFLHKRDVIHRDLKCDNLFLTAEDNVKVADFGVSRQISKVEESSALTQSIGTSYYVCPTITRGMTNYDTKVDVYSFAITAVEIIIGKMFPYPDGITPIQAQMQSALNPKFRPDVNLIRNSRFPELEDLIKRCWSHDPNDRPSFEDIYDELRDLIPEEGKKKEKRFSRRAKRAKSR